MSKNVYDRLCDSFGLQLGPVPDRDNLIMAFKQTLPEKAAAFYFLIPIFGEISHDRLVNKARRKGFSETETKEYMDKLLQESFIERFQRNAGPSFKRVFGVFVAENQVRKKKGTALGKRYAKYWMDLAEVSTYNLPTKTPYARVLTSRDSISADKEKLVINEPIQDTSQILPYDRVAEMMRNATTIALSECYCRLSTEMVGKGCDHEKETCFLFNETGQNLIEIGVARPVSLQEALEIVSRCEDAGLVHNTSNCEDEITFMCNCCPCCCPIIGAMQKGLTNVGQASRYIAEINPDTCQVCATCIDFCYVNALLKDNGKVKLNVEKCIGCGLCASHCPEGAIRMILREEPAKIYPTSAKLNSKIQREAVIGKIKSLVVGK